MAVDQRPVSVGAGHVGVEELAEQGFAAADRDHHGFAAIDALEHEALEGVLGGGDVGREGDEGAAEGADVFDRAGPGLGDGGGGGCDHVLDRAGDQPALDLVGLAAALEVGPAALHLADDGADQRHVGEVGERDEAGAEGVVDVVGVVGDVVGDGGDLGLEAGVGVRARGRGRAAAATTGPLCLRMPSSVSQVRLRPSCSA